MTDRTPSAPVGESPEVDVKMKLTQSEALLAVMVEHLETQVRVLRGALGEVLIDLGARSHPEGYAARAMEALYPEQIDPANPATKRCQAPAPPFPPHWLGTMARTGRSLAQVGRGFDVAERVTHALGGAK